MSNDILRIGDTVMWRGGFGTAPARPTKVTDIEVCDPGFKEGTPVDEIPWSEVRGRRVVVSTAAGPWAYGEQISRIEAAPGIAVVLIDPATGAVEWSGKLEEFLIDNAETIDAEEAKLVRGVLAAGGVYYCGGGAAPERHLKVDHDEGQRIAEREADAADAIAPTQP
jgi:hypothetical protein